MARHMIKRLRTDQRGATAVEYALVAMLISIATVASMLALGASVEDKYENVGTEYADAANQARN